jgi:hypothetical protein
MNQNPAYRVWDARWYLLNDGGRGGGGVYHNFRANTLEEAETYFYNKLGYQEGAYLLITATSPTKERVHEELLRLRNRR